MVRDEKSRLEQAIEIGLQGPPELRREERRQYLGEFRERVIIALTQRQVEEYGTYPQVEDGIRHSKAKKLVVSRRVNLTYAKDYIRLANQHGLTFTTVDSPDHKGEIGLIVVSDEAVDIPNIFIESREEKLRQRGVPDKLIKAVGKTICEDCVELLQEKAPEELKNYPQPTWFDRLLGRKCFSCKP